MVNRKIGKLLPYGVLLLLAASFFGFVDDRFRGWSDTHQYQVEARAWKKGGRPAVKELMLDKTNPAFAGPTHVAPLVPYLWSFLVDLTAPNETIHRISIFQAFLLAWSFTAFVFVLGQGAVTFDALTIAVILFFHGLVRWWVYMPMSEPQSVALLLTSYLSVGFSGIGAALQIITRPPVAILQLPQLIRNRKSFFVVGGFLLAGTVGAVFFRELIKPSTFQGIGWETKKSLDAIIQFREESSWIFRRILPYQKSWFQVLWSGVLAGLFLLAIFRAGLKKCWVWLILLFYMAEVLLATGEGFRYFFPAVVFLLAELKPRWPRTLWIKVPVLALVVHLCVQQAEAVRDLRKDRFPESDSPGLMGARQWIWEHHSRDTVIMMFRYRFCVNYFDAPCVPLPAPGQQLANQIREKHVGLVVINRLYWQTEELAFEKDLETYLKSVGYPAREKTRVFDNVRVIEVDPGLLPRASEK